MKNAIVKYMKDWDSFFSSIILGTTIGLYPVLKGFRGKRRLRASETSEAHKLLKECSLRLQVSDLSTLKLASQSVSILDQLENMDKMPENLDVLDLPYTLKLTNYQANDNAFARNLDELCQDIQNVLGLPITVISTLVWRNYHTTDPSLFSGDWHFDRRPTNWYRLFIIASERVGSDCGPFTYLTRQQSAKLVRKGFRRHSENVFDFENNESKCFEGKRGDALIVDTQTLLHRAGNPSFGKSRDMIEVVFEV